MEKQTLIKLSTKAWHYQFMSWALGSLAPTSSNMFNLCPYFWLLICSIIASPIIVICRGFKQLFSAIEVQIEKIFLIPIAESWYENLTNEDAVKMWEYQLGWSPNSFENYLDRLGKSHNDVLKEIYERDTGKKIDKVYDDNREFREWINNIRDKIRDKKTLKESRVRLSDKLVNSISNTLDNIKEYISDWSTIIKWTKRFVGLVITTVGLFLTYVVVSFISKGTIWLIINWDWKIFFEILLGLGAFAIFAGIVALFITWVQFMNKKGTELWYIKLLYYVIGIPIEYVFYHFLWRLIVLQILYGALKAFGQGFMSFLGIFGEYFGTSYTDYCPGIEWEEE